MWGKILCPTKFRHYKKVSSLLFYNLSSFCTCLLGAVVDPVKEGCTKAAVDFLISDLLKRAVTKHKGTKTSVNPEEDQGVEDHDEF